MSVFGDVFKSNRCIGIVGNRNTGKSSLVLGELVKLNKELGELEVFVFGVEAGILPYLETQGIKPLFNMEDIFDLKITNSVIYIDEIANFVSTQTRDKQTDRFKRFINRIVHNNCWFILSTAEVGFWNKLACSLINAFIVKEIELDSLVNGTWLKRIVLGLERRSDYRVDVPINSFFVVQSNELCSKKTFEYDINLDSKKDNVNPFKVVK